MNSKENRAIEIKAIKRVLNSNYKEFVKNPSAVNYTILERTMRIYQDRVKNYND